jgi:ferrochelatase
LSEPEVGVVLLNMGGPATLADIRPFLRNMFRDRAILPLPAPLRYAVAEGIAQLRSSRVRGQYAQIGGGSPILHITREQADVLRAALAEEGVRAEVTVAMRYTPPRAREALLALPPSARARVVGLPLYPQFSFATTASSLEDLEQAAESLGLPEPLMVRSWHHEPLYLDDLADRIEEAVGQAPEGTVVLFSAHGLPERSIRRGDPYRTQIEETVAGVLQRLGGVSWRLGFQSRVGPVQWTGPDTLDVVEELGREGRPVLVVPIAFVSDHVETLYELDVQVAEHARAHGVPWYERLPAQNATERFGRVLARVVSLALEEAW